MCAAVERSLPASHLLALQQLQSNTSISHTSCPRPGHKTKGADCNANTVHIWPALRVKGGTLVLGTYQIKSARSRYPQPTCARQPDSEAPTSRNMSKLPANKTQYNDIRQTSKRSAFAWSTGHPTCSPHIPRLAPPIPPARLP